MNYSAGTAFKTIVYRVCMAKHSFVIQTSDGNFNPYRKEARIDFAKHIIQTRDGGTCL